MIAPPAPPAPPAGAAGIARRAVIPILILLTVLAAGRSITHDFAIDDLPIIARNAEVHELAPPWVYARQSYWPPEDLGDGYRPWTMWWFAIEWQIGAGRPVVFRAFNVALATAGTLLVGRLAGALLPAPAAFAVAALFAVHPVHVEATANVVGQSELWMTVFVLLGCLWYLRARASPAGRGRRLSSGVNLGLAGLLVLAAASKEQGLVLPGLLACLELAIDRETGLRTKIGFLWPTYLFLALVGGAFVFARYLVLGDLGGGPPAYGVNGLGLTDRILVMLPLFLHGARLLVWPAVLRVIYSPPEFAAAPVLGLPALLGAGLLAGLAAAAILLRRRRPVVPLGLAWVVIAGAMVSNIAFPTGSLLAERTFFLPSVGALLAAAGAVGWPARGRRLRTIGVMVLVGLGLARSWSRQAVWKDNPTLYRQAVIDSPRSYVAHYSQAVDFHRRGELGPAIEAYRRAADLYDRDPGVFLAWGQALRESGRCAEAVPVFERGLAASPTSALARVRLIECLLAEARFDEARRVARAGVGLGLPDLAPTLERIRKKEAAAARVRADQSR